MAKISVMREFTFNAAHHLPDYPGPCARVHGHTYRLQVYVTRAGGILLQGFVIDFARLKKIVQGILEQGFDHAVLNDICDFPSAEFLAAILLDLIDEKLRSLLVRVTQVVLWETPTCCAIAVPDARDN